MCRDLALDLRRIRGSGVRCVVWYDSFPYREPSPLIAVCLPVFWMTTNWSFLELHGLSCELAQQETSSVGSRTYSNSILDHRGMWWAVVDSAIAEYNVFLSLNTLAVAGANEIDVILKIDL